MAREEWESPWDCSFCGAKEGEHCKSKACVAAAQYRQQTKTLTEERDTLLLQVEALQKQSAVDVKVMGEISKARDFLAEEVGRREQTIKLLHEETKHALERRDVAERLNGELQKIVDAAVYVNSIPLEATSSHREPAELRFWALVDEYQHKTQKRSVSSPKCGGCGRPKCDCLCDP